MEMITNTMANLTKINLTSLEIFLMVVTCGMGFVISINMTQIEKLKAGIVEMKIYNTRFYNMYMELSNNSLSIIAKWQLCLEENKDLIKIIEQNKKESSAKSN